MMEVKTNLLIVSVCVCDTGQSSAVPGGEAADSRLRSRPTCSLSLCVCDTGQSSAMPGGEAANGGGQDQHAEHPEARAQDQGDHHQEPGQAHHQEKGAIITNNAGATTAGTLIFGEEGESVAVVMD